MVINLYLFNFTIKLFAYIFQKIPVSWNEHDLAARRGMTHGVFCDKILKLPSVGI